MTVISMLKLVACTRAIQIYECFALYPIITTEMLFKPTGK